MINKSYFINKLIINIININNVISIITIINKLIFINKIIHQFSNFGGYLYLSRECSLKHKLFSFFSVQRIPAYLAFLSCLCFWCDS